MIISDSESSSDTSTSDSEAVSDFDLDPIGEEEEVSELESVSLDTAKTAVNVEAPRIERSAGGNLKARSKRPSGLVYTGNSKRTQRYRAAKNAADKREMDQNNKLMIVAQRPLTKYKETKISSFFKPLQPNKSIQEEKSEEESIQEENSEEESIQGENSEEEFEPAPGMDFFGTDGSDDSEYHPSNKSEKRSRAPTAKTCRNHKQNLEYMVAHRILPKDVRPGNKKLVWQSTLQLNRVNGLISFYNFILCGYHRQIASQLASQGMGKSPNHGAYLLRRWARDFERYDTLPASERGAHCKSYSLLKDPDIAEQMRSHLRSNKWSMDPTKLSEYSRGVMAPLTASKYQHRILNKEMPNGLARYVSQELLPDMGLKIKGGISSRTAVRWLRSEGFRYVKHAKGVYIDGHEREDVVECRQNSYIPTLRRLQPRMIEFQDDPEKMVLKDYEGQRPIVIVFHDEATFQANDDKDRSWVFDSQHKLKKKGVGKGVHQSDFIDPVKGWCKEASVQMLYGKDAGYWDGDKLVAQLKDIAIPALKKAHPGCQLLLIFDNSSGLSVYICARCSLQRKKPLI